MYLQVSVTCARAWLEPFSWALVGGRLGKAATVSAATSDRSNSPRIATTPGLARRPTNSELMAAPPPRMW